MNDFCFNSHTSLSCLLFKSWTKCCISKKKKHSMNYFSRPSALCSTLGLQSGAVKTLRLRTMHQSQEEIQPTFLKSIIYDVTLKWRAADTTVTVTLLLKKSPKHLKHRHAKKVIFFF